MTKIVMYFDPNVVKLSGEGLTELGRHMATYVARTFSTKDIRLVPSKDIDFLPTPYPVGYIAAPIAIEIETIGFPERKAKVTKIVTEALKHDIIHLFKENSINFDAKNSLIWVKYVDPDGHHV